METKVAAIEFGSKKLKIVIGYTFEGQVYTIYTLVKNYSDVFEGVKIINKKKLVNDLLTFKDISDSSAKLKITINDALLALPPCGLNVLMKKTLCPVVTNEKIVKSSDIKNLYGVIKDSFVDNTESTLVTIVPETYILDSKTVYKNRVPLNEKANSITIIAKVHMLPQEIPSTYNDIFKEAGISLRSNYVAPFAACELLRDDPEVPPDYLLVDIGSNITTVSLIGHNQLFASSYFEWGGDDITERIIEAFNINEADAEKYKVTYGINRREMNFKAPVCITINDQGQEVKHYSHELNAIIESELDAFLKLYKDTLEEVLRDQDPTCKTLPMVLIGGGSRLNGLVDYLSDKVESTSVHTYIPKVLGARNATFTNCLGMIAATSRYPNIQDDNNVRVGPLTREDE